MLTKEDIIRMIKVTPIGKRIIKYNNGTKVLWFTIGLISGFAIGYCIRSMVYYHNRSKQI